jgi:hypothetical protein
MAGMALGTTMRHRISNSPRPSTRAALNDVMDVVMATNIVVGASDRAELLVEQKLPQRLVLEHHRDVPGPRRLLVHAIVADPDAARILPLKPGNQTQKRGFPASRRADKRQEFAGLDPQINAGENRGLPEGLRDSAQFKAVCQTALPCCGSGIARL